MCTACYGVRIVLHLHNCVCVCVLLATRRRAGNNKMTPRSSRVFASSEFIAIMCVVVILHHINCITFEHLNVLEVAHAHTHNV